MERTLVAISTTTGGTETPGDGGGGGGDERKDGGGGREGGGHVEGEAGESPSVLEEFLLQNGDSSRYINEILISRVLEEVSYRYDQRGWWDVC